MTSEAAAHLAADRPTWRRLIGEKTERIAAFEHHVLPQLLNGLGLGRRWLEIGCGLGWASAVVASERPYPDLTVTATDSVELYLAQHARRLATFFGVDVDFVAADAVRLPFAAGTFDRVFSQHVLYRLDSPQLAMREAYRVLATGGRWIAIERAAPWCWPWSAHERRRFRRRNQDTGLAERAYTARQWRWFFRQAGVPATLSWATRKGRIVRWLTNAVRAEHLMVTVERP